MLISCFPIIPAMIDRPQLLFAGMALHEGGRGRWCRGQVGVGCADSCWFIDVGDIGDDGGGFLLVALVPSDSSSLFQSVRRTDRHHSFPLDAILASSFSPLIGEILFMAQLTCLLTTD